MRPPGRLSAAIEILEDILSRHRPASAALADWGKAHRFAGAADRSAIGNLVYDALRRRASCAFLMGSDSPRALALGALRLTWGMDAPAIGALTGVEHGPAPLTGEEAMALTGTVGEEAPAHVRADVTEWVMPSLSRAFGDDAMAEGAALACRAPVDLRVNSLKASRAKLAHELDRFGAEPTRWSPVGLRIPPAASGPGRNPNIEAEAAHAKGWFEVQDEGSQIVALLAGAKPGLQVADICAGAGGKTLAMAATMENKGQILAYDSDRMRLKPIFDRLQRAGVRNAQVLRAGERSALSALEGKMDLVFLDAPCSGSGAWRRRPDTKWRLKPRNLAERIDQQRAVLVEAARLVRPGGRLVYVTCSILPEENVDQVDWLAAQTPALAALPYRDLWRQALPGEPPDSADGRELTLLLTPRRHGTDGVFFAAWT
ncbi:MAG: RsmB/NOP family class I SAM-dependent RNA methyltransferase, partial [Hyphomicrobiaceae bacterium]